jgi:hypothetical protein
MTQGRLHANAGIKLDRKGGERDTIMILDGLWLAHSQTLSNWMEMQWE